MDEKNWNDWKWQLANSLRGMDDLKEYITLTTSECEALHNVGEFAFSITPFLAEKLKESDEDNPLRMQFIPNHRESSVYFTSKDYLCESTFEPVPNLLHKYEDRVAVLTTNCCAAYCRHCTRSRLVSHRFGKNVLDSAIEYIKEHENIADVLLTGGDPLILGDDVLDDILGQIASISHVKMIRIGTRTPVTLPMRITPNLISVLKKYKPLYINIHVNHPMELSSETQNAISMLVDTGFPLGSQSVLLRGINDNVDILEDLFKQLLYFRVKPYYLYQCDELSGCEAFWVSPLKGQKLINALNGKLSGMAVPKYVVDMPGNLGKQIIAPCNLIGIHDNEMFLENYKEQKCSLHI